MQQVIIPSEIEYEVYDAGLYYLSASLHVFFRWLDRSEDDGQIVRELLPFSDGQRLYSKFGDFSVILIWLALSVR